MQQQKRGRPRCEQREALQGSSALKFESVQPSCVFDRSIPCFDPVDGGRNDSKQIAAPPISFAILTTSDEKNPDPMCSGHSLADEFFHLAPIHPQAMTNAAHLRSMPAAVDGCALERVQKDFSATLAQAKPKGMHSEHSKTEDLMLAKISYAKYRRLNQLLRHLSATQKMTCRSQNACLGA